MSIHFHLSSSWDKIFRHETHLTVSYYQQQQSKTTWSYSSIKSGLTKPYDHIKIPTAATQNHMTMLHYQQQQQQTHDHLTLSAAATQNHMTILHYQQQQHKTTWPCYIISSNNTKLHDYVTLSAAATRNHMTMLHYRQQPLRQDISHMCLVPSSLVLFWMSFPWQTCISCARRMNLTH